MTRTPLIGSFSVSAGLSCPSSLVLVSPGCCSMNVTERTPFWLVKDMIGPKSSGCENIRERILRQVVPLDSSGGSGRSCSESRDDGGVGKHEPGLRRQWACQSAGAFRVALGSSGVFANNLRLYTSLAHTPTLFQTMRLRPPQAVTTATSAATTPAVSVHPRKVATATFR